MTSNNESNIRVCVRIRPFNAREIASDMAELNEANNLVNRRMSVALMAFMPKKAVAAVDERILVFDPSDLNKPFQKGVPTHSNKRTKDIRYIFDRVLDEKTTQVDVYEETTRPLIDGVLNGFNATVFAYGVCFELRMFDGRTRYLRQCQATGAGKTYTISGTTGNPGVMP